MHQQSLLPLNCPLPTETLAGRSILITGGTGFIGKAVIAKLVRDVPTIERIFVLVRRRGSATSESIDGRLSEEILGARPLEGLDGTSLVRERLHPVEGDLAQPDLGLAPRVREELCRHLSVIINCAGAVEFDGDIRVSTRVNTLAPAHLLGLARACSSRCAFIHVSTAYTNGLRRGVAKEEPLVPDRSIAADLMGSAAPHFSLDDEIEQGLHGERDDQGTPLVGAEARVASLARARRHGWTDTYTFTKALGEQLLSRSRGGSPIAIVRPSIVGSSFTDPFPGWIQGLKVMDPLIIAYAKGQLNSFVGDPDRCLDIVPLDYVVNTIVASTCIITHRDAFDVFQVSSGITNPIVMRELADAAISHFSRNPLPGKRASDSIRFLSRRGIARRIQLGRTLCKTVSNGCRLLPGTSTVKRQMKRRMKEIDRIEAYADLYLPYVTYDCQFDSSRTEALLQSLPQSVDAHFGFDAREIEWAHYLDRIHIPGLRRFVLGETLPS